MNYIVYHGRRGKVFASYEEAVNYCNYLIVEKNLFVAMETTKRKATHTFKR